MTSRLVALCLDAVDPRRIARFWAGLLGRHQREYADGVRVAGDDAVDLRVRRRPSGSVRGRSDLPRAHRARLPDRPENVFACARRAPSKRALSDLALTGVLAGFYEPDEHGNRGPESPVRVGEDVGPPQPEGIQVARCTVERLMRVNG